MGHYLKPCRTKYIECCIKGCRKTGPGVELIAHVPKGNTYHAFFCTEESHQLNGFNIVRQIERGVDIDTLDVRQDQIWVRGSRESGKPSRAGTEPKLTNAVKSWKWIEDFDRWMNVKGKTVNIRKLSNEEIYNAISAIYTHNISRATKRVKWAKELMSIEGPPVHVYPSEQIEVGQEEAYAKLEEFYEVCAEKEILP